MKELACILIPYVFLRFYKPKIMEKKNFQQLSKDEMGKLHGGFAISPIRVDTSLFGNNGNCDGGGIGDNNSNCRCEKCDRRPDPDPDPDPDEDNDICQIDPSKP